MWVDSVRKKVRPSPPRGRWKPVWAALLVLSLVSAGLLAFSDAAVAPLAMVVFFLLAFVTAAWGFWAWRRKGR